MRYVERAIAAIVVVLITVSARPAAGQEAVVYNFGANSSDGGFPGGGLLIDTKGNLFGTTILTGPSDGGTVFELSPVAGGGWSERVIHRFTGYPNDGAVPESALVSDKKGDLFGTTIGGGRNELCGNFGNLLCGTVFEISPESNGSWTESVIYSFGSSATDAFGPTGNLVFDAQGNLYGTTNDGGQNGYGAVFELSPDGGGDWTEKILYSFGATATDGRLPNAGLAIDSAGNFYGTTFNGAGTSSNGTVFELSREQNGTWTEKILHAFDPGEGDGANPVAGLILDSKGNLYGTTDRGGDDNAGTVFELSPATGGVWTEKVFSVYSNSEPGFNPQAGLTMDSHGNLYGTTTFGGSNVSNNFTGGTVFELTPHAEGTWTETVLHSFPATAADGNTVTSGVIFDSRGNLYGTTGGGGTHGYGTVFEIGSGAVTTQVGTTITLVANPSSDLVAGEPITLTATVIPATGTAVPTGTIVFADPAGGSVKVPLNTAGEAVYSGTVPRVGTYLVFASYSGAPGFAPGDSVTLAGSVTIP